MTRQAGLQIQPPVREWLQRLFDAGEESALSGQSRPLMERAIEGHLTLAQAQRLATSLNISLVDLLAESPPKLELPIADYRTRKGEHLRAFEPNLYELTVSLIAKQSWLSEFRQETGFPICPLCESDVLLERAAVPQIVEFIRQVLGWTESPPAPRWSSLAKQLEDLGVMVICTSYVGMNTRRGLSPDEVRGLAIWDRRAPLIFVNSKDADSARVFTACHELSHLVLAESAVSDPDWTAPHRRREQLCNAVAAELLMPEQAVREVFSYQVPTEESVRNTAARFAVSPLALAIRVKNLGLILADHADRLIGIFLSQPTRSVTLVRRNRWNQVKAANGEVFLTTVLAQTATGGLSYREAKNLLGVSYDTLFSLLEMEAKGGRTARDQKR